MVIEPLRIPAPPFVGCPTCGYRFPGTFDPEGIWCIECHSVLSIPPGAHDRLPLQCDGTAAGSGNTGYRALPGRPPLDLTWREPVRSGVMLPVGGTIGLLVLAAGGYAAAHPAFGAGPILGGAGLTLAAVVAALFARTGGAFRLTVDANVLRVSVSRVGVRRLEHEVGVDRIREVRVRRAVNASTSHRAAPVGKYFSLQLVCAEGTLDVVQTVDARIAACLALHVARSTGVEWRLAVPAA